ncbi:hypothetical protein DET61_12416 [Marinobacter nauticus]|jgi:hypothetical protein|uniref:Integrase catalytic domain-containing protein n=1 Tax=Marinobacter nauticus TaxID=2743 RepID=A0A368X415_MARNT|nr:hypothetical protein [Marinobacter nauticus]RCW62545.1 hypothetical protein DET61_12416 [Marinobacter nauticus]
MRITWRDRLRQHPRLAELSSWPPLDPSLVPKKNRKHFLRNTRVVKQVLRGIALADAAKLEGLSPGRVTQLLNRCLGGDPERPPPLRRGLLPYQVVDAREGGGPGDGRFKTLLRVVPGLREGLDQMLLARLKDKPSAQVPTAASYHAEFKNLLAKAGWPLDAYPFDTASLAYESVRRDLDTRWTELCQALRARRKAFTSSPPSRDELSLYDRIEIDAQLVDCETSTMGIQLSLADHLPPLRLARFSVLTAIDASTECILGFHIAFGEPRQDDLLALLLQCVSRWPERRIGTKGLELPPGPGFPGSDPRLPLPLPREIAVDNAWINHASSVESFVTQELGATLSYGRPKCPTVRRTIETSFNQLNQRLSHRFTSTTGSSVTDPKRESAKNRKAIPVVSLPEYEDALYVTLAESNHRPRAHLASATPIETLRYQAERVFYVEAGNDTRSSWAPFKITQEVCVHDLNTPKRKPYINFEYLRYKGPGLLALSKGNDRVVIRADRRDIRQLEAFTLDGRSLGFLYCPRNWQSRPHGIHTRRYLFKHCRTLVRRSPDALAEYFHQLRERYSSPTEVAQLLRTYQEFVGGFGLPTALWPPIENTEDESISNAGGQPTVPRHPARSIKPKSRPRFWSLKLNPGASQ